MFKGLLDIFQKPKRKIKTITVDDIEYKYIKNKNSKSIKIIVKDPYTVTVSMPANCTYKAADEIIELNKKWIDERLNIMKTRQENAYKPENLIIERGLLTTSIKKRGENVIFSYPINKDFYSKEIQIEFKKAVKKALYIKAKEYLPKRLNELSNKFNFKYNKLALKVHKTRWGSCSFKNNINLNINLIVLDAELIDYVLIHELCHTVEKNHSKNFWALVEKCMPNYCDLRYKIKKQRFIL